MRDWLLIPLLLGSLASGCAAHELREFSRDVRREVVRVAPECRRPGPREAAACRTAARILSQQDPREATAIYTAHWAHVAFDAVTEPGGAGGGGGGGGGGLGSCNGPSLGSGGGDPGGILAAVLVVLVVVVVIAVVAVAIDSAVDAATLAAAQRITTRALRVVYERAGDDWSRHMLPELGRVRFEKRSSFRRFVDAASL